MSQTQSLETSPSVTGTVRGTSRQKRARSVRRGITLQIGSVAIFLILWQIIGSQLSPYLLSTPTRVAAAFFKMTIDGELPSAFVFSLEELFLGFAIAIAVGTIVGILMGRYRSIEMMLNPYINFLQATPLIALVPLLVIWFGIGFWADVAVVFTLSLPSLVINTTAGIKSTSRLLMEVGRIFHLNEQRMVREIALPNSMPYFFAGLRISVGKAVIGMIIAQMEVKLVGLGAIVVNYGDDFKTANLLAGVFTSSLIGVIAVVVIEAVQRRWFPWIAATQAQQRE